MQLLSGHTSPETAYLVPDYPYGFKLRCQLRCWIEYRPGKGFRFVTQTSNPKRPGTLNKPKAGIYCRMAGVMFLDDNGHVQFEGLSEYSDTAEITKYLDTYGKALSEKHAASLVYIVHKRMQVEAGRKPQYHTTIEEYNEAKRLEIEAKRRPR